MQYADLVAIRRFSSFATADAERQGLISDFLAEAASELNPCIYGINLTRAIALLALHKLTLHDRMTSGEGGGVTGQVTSFTQSMGSRSATIAQVAGDKQEEYFALTPYGLELLQLMRQPQCAITGMVV